MVIGKLTISNREISRHSAATIHRLRNRVAFFICDILKRVAAPADAKTCKSAEPQLLAANTKIERQEISRGSALVSQIIDHEVNALLTFGCGESPYAVGRTSCRKILS